MEGPASPRDWITVLVERGLRGLGVAVSGRPPGRTGQRVMGCRSSFVRLPVQRRGLALGARHDDPAHSLE
ncbi:hypothetical protein CHELA20_51962 [Hyphomicrobiales bacterium]|nr:hypothetical protein CHELA41_22965 [Hyphomicrobiales bacterium]CAH1679732.1 hypothetical protein CHELA20_51962 [Hyphomicrobiales bacterium]